MRAGGRAASECARRHVFGSVRLVHGFGETGQHVLVGADASDEQREAGELQEPDDSVRALPACRDSERPDDHGAGGGVRDGGGKRARCTHRMLSRMILWLALSTLVVVMAVME